MTPDESEDLARRAVAALERLNEQLEHIGGHLECLAGATYAEGKPLQVRVRGSVVTKADLP